MLATAPHEEDALSQGAATRTFGWVLMFGTSGKWLGKLARDGISMK